MHYVIAAIYMWLQAVEYGFYLVLTDNIVPSLLLIKGWGLAGLSWGQCVITVALNVFRQFLCEGYTDYALRTIFRCSPSSCHHQPKPACSICNHAQLLPAEKPSLVWVCRHVF